VSFRLNLPLLGSVCGKVRHWSEREAEHAAILLRDRERITGTEDPGRIVNSYLWSVCRAWHVGHRRS
jgi:hypothetical protein